jgi:hypothetical protein
MLLGERTIEPDVDLSLSDLLLLLEPDTGSD